MNALAKRSVQATASPPTKGWRPSRILPTSFRSRSTRTRLRSRFFELR